MGLAMSMTALQGKRCLVTGATGGLGGALCTALARNGANLFATGRDGTALERLRRQFTDDCASAMAADLRRFDDIEALVSDVRARLGGIDVLINCAGVFPVKSLSQSSIEDFDACFALNVRAPFLLSAEFAGDMARSGWGRIVNIGSSSAYSGFKDTSIYCASKHALLGFSRALNDELKSSGVRTFCISPGSIDTTMGREGARGQDIETFLDPHEISKFIVDLISYDGPMIAEEVRLNRMTYR
jgi:NAD(P)-dependent dehydrogenase (short-subunit alcohol dehydrogenase family)